MTEIITYENSSLKHEAVQEIIFLFKSTCDYAKSDPKIALNHARITAEAICKYIFKESIGEPSKNIMLDGLITQLDKFLPYKTQIPLKTINNYGSFGSHYQKDISSISPAFVLPCILALIQFMDWFITEYIQIDYPEDLISSIYLHDIVGISHINNDKTDDISDKFSNKIISEHEKINITIDRLTKEQFSVIQTLKGEKRVLISGCAGSGKTLVAVEKSIRLDRAGLDTLLLCHNKYLASYMRNLVNGTGVTVYSFYEWINSIVPTEYAEDNKWSHYEEPTELELNTSFDHITYSAHKYDAVIVDEGQDFRDTWWTLVEAALKGASAGILYIFYDDNQSLLPHRSAYPITESKLMLSKNCRNSGAIFERVTKFLTQAPATSGFLSKKGTFKITEISKETIQEDLELAVRESLKYFSARDITILTTEPDPIENSQFIGMNITINDLMWQDLIYKYAYPNTLNKGQFSQSLSDLHLSNEEFPNEYDIKLIRNHFRNLVSTMVIPSIGSKHNKTKSSISNIETKLVYKNSRLTFNRTEDRLGLYHYLSSYQWVTDLQKTVLYNLSVTSDAKQSNSIRLYTVSSFKGLESDAVILLVPPSSHLISKSNLYVGFSRPRIYLHVLVCGQISNKYVHIFDN